MTIPPLKKVTALKKSLQDKVNAVDTEYYAALDDKNTPASTLTKLKNASIAYHTSIEDLNDIIDTYADIDMDLKAVYRRIKNIK